ncbi:hypothetical protein BJY14_003771 [Actinomadura luteofluorescens]|uniref:Uncharacterized protein n=1 Tax=Actinomadura luteofluorescens TaxID=46163 RepID=A0A7Y9EHD5_9ACTN|nr:hypothetical protein [Actinomadura luteofluorescens]
MLLNAEATAWWPTPQRVYRDRPAAGSGRDAIRV